MPTLPVIPDEVLGPISSERPAGEDLRASEDWVKIRDARPNPYENDNLGMWTPAESSQKSWSAVSDLATTALTRKSKDLRVAIWLTEASIKLHGFAGMRDGIHTVRELLTRFWDSGLYPLITDDDLEMRSGPLEWMNEKMADALREIPLTQRSQPGDNYSYFFYQDSRRPTGKITAEEFEKAVQLTPLAFYETFAEDFEEARGELKLLERVSEEKFGSDGLALSESKEALDQLKVLLDRILREKREKEAAAAQAAQPLNGAEGAQAGGSSGLAGVMGSQFDGNSNSSWGQAESLARSGKIDQALIEMTRLASAEPNGRARFQRKLLLADICLSTKRDRLAKTILEELAEMIDKYQLESWETSEVIGAVWSRLYSCYRNEAAGIADADRAAVLFQRLARLDPWQALKCNA